jgi:hypothetical protein
MPAMTPKACAAEGERRHLHEADRLEQRVRAERLRPLHLARAGGSMMPVVYNNGNEIVQGPATSRSATR